MAKNPDGIETNFQLAIERKAKKTYEVPTVKEEKDIVVVKEEEEFFFLFKKIGKNLTYT